MGIYDREYYRREGPSFLDSFAVQGQVCKWLLIVNIVAFVVQLLTRTKHLDVFGHPVWLPGPFTDTLLLNTRAVLEGQVWRLLTWTLAAAAANDFLQTAFVALNRKAEELDPVG